jgi:NAD(P)-dependent dehydrogenase (short-subunit alcohol dehydrogenase family)
MTAHDAYLRSLFSLDGQVAVVTGGSGVLGAAMAEALAMAGARVAILGRRQQLTQAVALDLKAKGAETLALSANVLDRDSLAGAKDAVLKQWGALHLVINAAGGNIPAATVAETENIFGMSTPAFQQAVELNLTGTLLPSLVFGEAVVQSGGGAIINVSSMASARALTRVAGYGAAKAAVENLTRWLAVELGHRYGGAIRVNAIAPGFFIGAQNRDLLLEPDGRPTDRGRAVVAHTPAGRFGQPNDLAGAVIWLCGPSARFVNGIVLPVDGGFGAFGGV